MIKKDYGTSISRNTVYAHESKLVEEYLSNKEKEIEELLKMENIQESGIYHYDEEFRWEINIIKPFRLTILDDETYDDY